MNKHILFVTTGDIKNVATMKRALGLANPMVELGWDVSIIAQNTIENRIRINIECSKKVNVIWFDSTNVWKEIKLKTSFCLNKKPSFIYLCSLSIRNYIIKPKVKRYSKILVEHSELASSIKNFSSIKRLKFFLLEVYSIFYADYLVNASKYLMTYYSKLYKRFLKSKYEMHYSPYAYNSDVMSIEPKILTELNEKFKYQKVFLYIGNMAENYGLFTMINAANQLKKHDNSFKLVLIGSGRHLNKAKEFVEQNNLSNNVIFTGYVSEEELSSYFRVADAFISPLNNTVQDWARCPSKIYMYLPFNKPILTSNIGEPREIFGDNGLYFDIEKENELLELFKNIFDGELESYNVDIQNHSWQKRAEDFNNWISSLSN
nr:glycosyltransferase [uncultured Draconibacterium sp.]